MVSSYITIIVFSIWMLSLTLAISLHEDTTCPCDIDDINKSIDCSRRNLTTIPECVISRTDYKYLDFSVNRLSSIAAGIFTNFTELLALNLSKNYITDVGNESFKGLNKLKVLRLSHNHLDRNDSFSVDTFESLTSLKYLHIQGNLQGSDKNYPDQALSRASSVKFLAIDGLPQKIFGPGFRGMKSLSTLRLDSDHGFCDLGDILPGTFDIFRETHLEHLKLIHCHIQSLPPFTFSRLANITSIEATWSRTMCDGMVDNFTVGLNSTNIKRLQLTHMCNSYSLRFNKDTFRGLTDTSLEYLEMEGNRIEFIDEDCVHNLPKSLKYFSLKDNYIDDAHFLAQLKVLPNLETVDVSYQNYYSTKYNSSSPRVSKILTKRVLSFGNKHHKRPVMAANKQNIVVKFTTQPNGTSGSYTNNTSNKSFVKVTSKTSNDDRIPLPPKLRFLYGSHIKLDSYAIIPLTFTPNILEYLDASFCNLQGFLGPWIGLQHLKYLDMSNNKFKVMHPKSLSDMGNLRMLFLQNNEIGDEIMDLDKRGDLFANQTKVVHLDISRNNFRELPHLIFRNQRKLVNLSLSWNSLSDISFALDSMVNLKLLNLSYNQIRSISKESSGQFDKITTTSDLYLDLRGNPLLCDCQSLNFVNWLAETNVKLIENHNLTCTYKNGSRLSIRDIVFIRNQLQIDCVTWIFLIASSCGLVGLLVVVAFAALYHHKRWQLRYLKNTSKSILNPFHTGLNEEIDIDNDVYLSYDSDYMLFNGTELDEFVKTRLYPYLVNNNLSVLFQDHLQSEAGKTMTSIITNIVTRSRKVVALLSSSYFTSGDTWKAWEFNMAIHEGIYTKRCVMVPVVIGELTQDDLRRQPEIRSYLNSMAENVLKFPNREQDVDAFFKRLYNKIQE